MKALITGINGFVGSYLKEELEQNGYEVLGVSRSTSANNAKQLDLLKKDTLLAFLKEIQVDVIFHLAGQASVARSWQDPQNTFELNVIATLNLLECVENVCPNTKILIVGSSDQYGNLKERGESVCETMPLFAQNPYAISKKAQEDLALLFAHTKNIPIYCTRSFNHAGAKQKIGFMIPDFSSGIVSVERGEKEFLSVGNLEAKRDFTHVKDIARAYRLIVERGTIGEVYNVGSGNVYSAQEILDKLISLSDTSVIVKKDPDKMRPSDTPVIRCDNTKLKRETGWEAKIGLDVILEETLNQFRNQF